MGNVRLRSFILYNQLSNYKQSTCKRITSFFSDACDYYYDIPNIWVFIPQYSIPIPIQHIKNDISFEWMYHSTTNTISTKQSGTRYCKLDWLSATIVIYTESTHIEYDIDDFLSSFYILTSDSKPSLSHVYCCWCIYTKQWFVSNTTITFNIIDSEGNEKQLLLHDRYETKNKN